MSKHLRRKTVWERASIYPRKTAWERNDNYEKEKSITNELAVLC